MSKTKEIEVKILEINPSEIQHRLDALGATCVFSGQVYAVKMDFPNGRLYSNESFIRIRTLGETTELTYKGPKEKETNLKIQPEIQVNTSDLEKTISIFEQIGMIRVEEQRKHRSSYVLDNIKFDLDVPQEFPPLIEVEAPSRELVNKGVEQLGYTMAQTSNMTTTEMLAYYTTRRIK